MLNKIRDMEKGLEYDFGKIYAFDNEDEALNFYQTLTKNFFPVKTFTNATQTKFYCQIENLFAEILNPTISVAIPNIIPKKEIENDLNSSIQNNNTINPFDFNDFMTPPVEETEGEIINENN